MKDSQNSGYAFLAIAMAFFAIGISNQTALLGVAVAFFVIGINLIAKSKRNSDSKQ